MKSMKYFKPRAPALRDHLYPDDLPRDTRVWFDSLSGDVYDRMMELFEKEPVGRAYKGHVELTRTEWGFIARDMERHFQRKLLDMLQEKPGK